MVVASLATDAILGTAYIDDYFDKICPRQAIVIPIESRPVVMKEHGDALMFAAKIIKGGMPADDGKKHP